FLFFQAEDGIRDFHVTGVQTCALPILRAIIFSTAVLLFVAAGCSRTTVETGQSVNALLGDASFIQAFGHEPAVVADEDVRIATQIGRATCRERVRIWYGTTNGDRRIRR